MTSDPTNSTTTIHQTKQKQRLPQAHRVDQEFLPAALEILERPASPVASALLLSICAFVAIAIAWSWIGMTDIVAVAHGKVQPTGKVKVVQPLEAGKVRRIAATNGDFVQEGGILVELDPDDATAEANAAQAAWVSWRAEADRRRQVIAAAGGSPIGGLSVVWPDYIPEPIRLREETVGRADLHHLSVQLLASDAQAAQKRAERDRLSETISAQLVLIDTLRERADIRSSLLQSNAGTRTGLIDAMEPLNYQRMVIVGLRGQLAEAERALETIAAERERTLRSFLAENTTKRAEAQRQADEAEQRLVRARLKVERMTLRSPVSGIVQASSVTSVGQVLIAGQDVLRVVPRDTRLEIEVYLENKDIGFVRAGQPASIKVEAFPFTRYGILDATVVRVATDAIPEPEARQNEADPARPAQGKPQAGAERVRSLVFPVVLSTVATHVAADGRQAPLSPGMAVTAEIKTGQRRILEYILSPVVEMVQQAGRER